MTVPAWTCPAVVATHMVMLLGCREVVPLNEAVTVTVLLLGDFDTLVALAEVKEAAAAGLATSPVITGTLHAAPMARVRRESSSVLGCDAGL